MKEEKKWDISWSVLYKSGQIDECSTRLTAPDIFQAAEKAKDIIRPRVLQDEVEEVVLWNVGIVDEWVF